MGKFREVKTKAGFRIMIPDGIMKWTENRDKFFDRILAMRKKIHRTYFNMDKENQEKLYAVSIVFNRE
jgi:protein-tyrosine-phosphatase